ncbi:helix-turn-helix domain-containing protein [Patulibacter sp.]|uniref:helix-turn-helix domain-containing protein n=1 Tax=Patulibacter sp. TaxID=1912859 RepID=UPI002728386F|nr:helix-turn-helix transcriptional regulator [Patulibacter sp.]MDO9407815.1 helix-turn-helix transcriptional regulator [Patulibacter sp.]
MSAPGAPAPPRSSLAEFLRASRARVEPGDVGLPDDGRPRRVPGLRREEVAQLANVSVDYVVRLEQGRSTGVSRQVLDALADALVLDDAGRDYLLTVAGPPPRRRGTTAPQAVPAPTLRVLDALGDTPAMILGPCSDVLAWNRMAAALITDFGALPPEHRNMVRLAFLDPAFRSLYGDWSRVAQDCVAALRMEAGRNPDDARVTALVGELSVKDTDFRRWWGDHRVRGSNQRRKQYVHPVAGPMILDVQRFALLERPDLMLVSYTAAADTEAEAALRFLAGWAPRGPVA